MPSPFPGMDPYLEQASLWSEFHSRLIVAIADALAPELLPQYYVAVETRTYWDGTGDNLLVGIPDAIVLSTPGQSAQERPQVKETGTATTLRPRPVVLPMPLEIRERFLEIRAVGSDAVITVLEVLSPANKRQGQGRSAYEAKRQKLLSSSSHLIEIDLLRSEQPMAMRPVDTEAPSAMAHYRILVSRWEHRPQADLYEFTLREPIPLFPLPLKGESEAIVVDLQSILQGIYDRSGYRFRLNYRSPAPPPPLIARGSSVDERPAAIARKTLAQPLPATLQKEKQAVER